MGSLWNRSGLVERYADDLRAAGAKAYFYNGGTTTALVVYEDSGESASHSHPLLADANGRWPDVFVPYITSYDVRVTSADDVQLTFSRQIPNPDPVELTVTADPLQSVVTGMIHAELINSTRTGYVRLNGRNIGNAASTNPNTERANGDTLALFTYLWNACSDAVAPVSGGRTNPAADFAANKTLTLPNLQGGVPIGLDDMGASAGGFFSGLTFGVGSATAPGSRTGANGAALSAANIPAHAHSGTTNPESAHTHNGTTLIEDASHTHTGSSTSDSGHNHTVTINDPQHSHVMVNGSAPLTSGAGGGSGPGSSGATSTIAPNSTGITATIAAATGTHTHNISTGAQLTNHHHGFQTDPGSAHSHSFNTDSVGGSAPFNNLPRSVLVTWFIKL